MKDRSADYRYVIRIWPVVCWSIKVGTVCGMLRSAAVIGAAIVNVGVNEGGISLEIIAA